ncbi:hypothetical protein M2475_000783 [Breznakia sp. PF5-3]|uniref:DUF6323 family protein n=1 Tax=unclassified Breznakia TaxID=2623764 RepID=UPI0024051230|nr:MULTISPECIES: DUF6323 family protein [unclassified Breznakia]MDF9824816.1 hypothetical protein [Breznakia sp. PM6-1]MDF9835222.1 hypothetical protein [Breznakia sp. PF5-3]MDF9837334.1 hypothetical protein [Breznakia sp. PFB2-8]MDF9859742.1 hypothetical protein [Breznakia sp. PH5-24]
MKYYTIKTKENTQMIIKEVNAEIASYGFSLSEEDYQFLLAKQKELYTHYNLIDLDTTIIKVIAMTVNKSPYIRQSNYVDLIVHFLDLFYACRKQIGTLHYDDEIIYTLYQIYLLHYGEISTKLLYDTLKILQEKL